MIFRYIIDEETTVKDFLLKKKIPSNVIASLKHDNAQILVNDQSVTSIFKLHIGDLLELVFPASNQGDNILSIKGDFEIVYEDAYMLIINKQNNIACIPTRKHYDHSLANYVMSYYKRNGIKANIHFVSRLDAPTSGLVILAKNSYMMTLLKEAIIEKVYILEVCGKVLNKEGIIELGIEKDPNSIIKRKINPSFINSKTAYQVIGYHNSNTFIKALLLTGKTHQLRLHFSYLGFPIVGDALYNELERNDENSILHLHSYKISFVHPITHEKMEFINYPKWFKKEETSQF